MLTFLTTMLSHENLLDFALKFLQNFTLKYIIYMHELSNNKNN